MSNDIARAGSPSDGELASIIESGAGCLNLGLDAVQSQQLVLYLRLIARWNATYNLTAVRDLKAMATQHIVDSLSLIGALRARIPSSDKRILDVGSGAGLPGVVVAILQRETPVVCVDSVGKKAAFLTQVAATLKLHNLSSVHSRVEEMTDPHAFGVIVSRAFSSLLDFVSSTRPLLATGGWWIAMKGKVPHQEMRDAESSGVKFEVQPISVPRLDAERCLIFGQPIQSSER